MSETSTKVDFSFARIIVIVGFAAINSSVNAETWPNYRGVEGNGILPERIQLQWSEEEPEVLWRQDLNHGFSSITVANGKVFTQVRRTVDGDDSEVCLALDLKNGNELWATPVGPAGYASGPAGPSGGSDGPRSTPVIHGEQVFVLSAQLGLSCLNIESGQVIWSRDLKREYRGRIPKWANAASPVIEGNMLLLNTGASANSLLALRTDDGEEVWRQGTEGSTYATPVCAEIHGVRQVIFLTRRGLVSVTPDTGDELWSYEFGNNERFCASPVVAGDIVYASGGYNIGAAAVRISKAGEELTATELWRKPGDLMNHWTTSVYHDGYLYGMFGSKAYNVAPLKCIKLETGEEMWSQRGFGNGSLLLAGDKLLALKERREVLVVDTDPTAYTELAKITPFDNTRGKVWNTPAVSDGRLYLRSTREIVAVDVTPPPSSGPLKLLTPTVTPEGSLQIEITDSEGGRVAPDRTAHIQVLTATDPNLPIEQWTRLNTELIADDAGLRIEDQNWSELPRRFYRLNEE